MNIKGGHVIRRVSWAMLIVITLAGCSRQSSSVLRLPDYQPDSGEFSVMTYNLYQYGYEERDQDGQADDLKPLEERQAVIDIIAAERPDVLAVQEIGSPDVYAAFCRDLQDAGLDYPHDEYLRRGRHENNMALLSRFPILARQSHTNDTYSIGEAELHVARGFIDVDIQVNGQYTFRILVAHLKSKVYHALGQTEMRRNEARLLNKHVRHTLQTRPAMNLMVVGDLNDSFDSAALREVQGKHKRVLFDTRPRDFAGTVWTCFEHSEDQYNRFDYILVSRNMEPELVESKTHAVIHSHMLKASDHRPIVAVFKSRDALPAVDVLVGEDTDEEQE
jgi:endonuclease/exonuclease/phosphatase family metal-dependent hydrolase